MQVRGRSLRISRTITYLYRVDLSVALRFGSPPLFFSNDVRWKTYLADTNIIPRQRIDHDEKAVKVSNFIEQNVDTKLRNVWADLATFASLANLAYQTGRRLEPSLSNETMVSTMYRLLHLSFPKLPMEEAIRLGLLAFCSTIFLQGQLLSRHYKHLVSRLRTSLEKLRNKSDAPLCAVRLWLVMMLALVSSPVSDDIWLLGWIDGILRETGSTDWDNAQSILCSIMWIGFLHDNPGRVIVEMSVSKSNKYTNDDNDHKSSQRHNEARTGRNGH